MPKSIVVKRYKNEKEYQKDVLGMDKRGYKVISVAVQQPRRSLFTVVMTGFLALLFPRRPELVVTYSLA
jgi:hypothetical protein